MAIIDDYHTAAYRAARLADQRRRRLLLSTPAPSPRPPPLPVIPYETPTPQDHYDEAQLERLRRRLHSWLDRALFDR
jgi:hypothetical protein